MKKWDILIRFTLVFFLGAMGASYFWVESRYPALNEKALMANDNKVSDLITTFPVYEIKPEYSYVKKVSLSTVNWIYENKKGMTAGVFLGAIFLTLFGYFRIPGSRNPFLNSFYGLLLGSPLGVCVNCAAPIFKGVLNSKRVELALSMMMSSPTMNVVVLTMVFALFPFYMAVTKVIFTLAIVLLCVPLLSKMIGNKKNLNDWKGDSTDQLSHALVAPSIINEESLRWWSPVLAGLKDLARNWWYIVSRTVPLMFVAGFLGAVVSHALPPELLQKDMGLQGVFILSAASVALPVPVAFDVILSNALFSAGLPHHLALILLCTLGITSIYSFFIVWQSASRIWALSVAAVVFVGAIGLGTGTKRFNEWFYLQPNIEAYHHLKVDPNFLEPESTAIDRYSGHPIDQSLLKAAESLDLERAAEIKNITLDKRAFFKPAKSNEPLQFTKKEGHEIGLTHGFRYGIRDYPDPFWLGRGTASGDYDGDGWQDILFGSNTGFYLYKNMGGEFKKQEIDNPVLKKLRVYGVAFVDFNNDSWLDIFFSTYAQGNYILVNKNGKYDYSDLVKVPNNKAVITVSPSFADVDGNGYVDIVNGNMALGIVTGYYRYSRRRNNSLTFVKPDLEFKERIFNEQSGETMSSLVSDLNGDNLPDIYFSNDFRVADEIHLSRQGGGFKRVLKDDQFISSTPYFSMSVDSGDLNNDGITDLITTGTIQMKEEIGSENIDGKTPADYTQVKFGLEQCEGIKDQVVRDNCKLVRQADLAVNFHRKRSLSVDSCHQLSSKRDRQDCLLSTMWMIVTSTKKLPKCSVEFKNDPFIQGVCELLDERRRTYRDKDFKDYIAQKRDSFIYLGTDTGGMIDFNKKMGDGSYFFPGGWTWNTRMVDLDNDGWQDIFGADGSIRGQGYGWNIYLKNMQGKKFEQKQFSSNLTDDFNLFSYVTVDFDNDGDLDIIGNSSSGPIQVYENHSSSANNSVSISLRDQSGNSYGVGAKVYLQYKNNQTQVQEMKGSGGYLSFNPYVLHFGLGKDKEAQSVKVIWRDGEITELKGPFAANNHYRISRNKEILPVSQLRSPASKTK